MKLFVAACIPNMGQPDAVRAWAAQKQLGRIQDAAPLAVFVGPGNKGDAWAVPTKWGKFALSIRGGTEACAVYAQTASPTLAEGDFKKVIEGVERPGIGVRIDRDSSTQTPFGLARVLAYNIRAPGALTGFEFTLLTVERPGGPFQATMQVAPANAG